MSGPMAVGLAARILKVTPGTLRRWEREGRIRPEFRTLGGHRRYAADEVARVKAGL